MEREERNRLDREKIQDFLETSDVTNVWRWSWKYCYRNNQLTTIALLHKSERSRRRRKKARGNFFLR